MWMPSLATASMNPKRLDLGIGRLVNYKAWLELTEKMPKLNRNYDQIRLHEELEREASFMRNQVIDDLAAFIVDSNNLRIRKGTPGYEETFAYDNEIRKRVRLAILNIQKNDNDKAIEILRSVRADIKN